MLQLQLISSQKRSQNINTRFNICNSYIEDPHLLDSSPSSNLNFKQTFVSRTYQEQVINRMFMLERTEYFEKEFEYDEVKHLCDDDINENIHVKFSSNIGINCVEAGFGKTVTILAVSQERCLREVKGVSQSNGVISIFSQKTKIRIPVTLIVTDEILIEDAFIGDINKFFNDYSYMKLYNEDDLKVNDRFMNNDEFSQYITQKKVVFVTCKVFHHLFQYFKHFSFDRLVIDEIQDRKIECGDRYEGLMKGYGFDLPFGMIWLNTATPEDIYKKRNKFVNPIIESSNFFKEPEIYKFILNQYSIRIDVNYLKTMIDIPDPLFIPIEIEMNNIQKLVKDHVVKEDENLLKDIYDMNLKTVMNKYCVNSNDDVLLNIKNNMISMIDRKIKIQEAKLVININQEDENKLKELKEEKRDLEMKYERIKTSLKDDECQVCFNNLGEVNILYTCCGSVLCPCSIEFVNKRKECINCRREITRKDINLITPSKLEDSMNRQYKNKFDALTYVLSSNYHKVLFFHKNNDDENVEILVNIMETGGYKIHHLKDKASLETFREDHEKSIMLLDSESQASGLNFEYVNCLIMYSEYPEERQIVARAQRMGRTEQCTIIKFINV